MNKQSSHLSAIGLLCILMAASCGGSKKVNSTVINWNDSSEVESYIRHASLCDKINLVIDSIHVFAGGVGYSIRVLASVSREAKSNLEIPIASRSIVFQSEYKETALKEQMEELKSKLCEPGKLKDD